MNPKVRIHLIETSKEIIRERGEKLTTQNIKIEFDMLVEALDVPRIVTTSTAIKSINRVD
jgi:hypothetical protein